MVELVLEAPGLEPHRLEGSPGVLDDDPRRATDVRGQIRDREASLARDLRAMSVDYPGVGQDHQAVVLCVGLRVGADVDGDHPGQLADLRGGEADAALEGTHRVEEVSRHGDRAVGLRGNRHLLEGRMG